ncbi:MAG TPA: hypothetical protein VGI10_09605 [Polyangiaceae bacterium]|jgi:hypothetical protein
MARLIHLRTRRALSSAQLPLELPVGDSDLKPIAWVLWIASVLRVTVEVMAKHSFGAEASLALLCALLMPWFIFFRARNRAATHATRAPAPRI